MSGYLFLCSIVGEVSGEDERHAAQVRREQRQVRAGSCGSGERDHQNGHQVKGKQSIKRFMSVSCKNCIVFKYTPDRKDGKQDVMGGGISSEPNDHAELTLKATGKKKSKRKRG